MAVTSGRPGATTRFAVVWPVTVIMELPTHSLRFGFTLIEPLVVMSIGLIISLVGLFQYRSYAQRQVVTQAAEQVRTVLVRARQRALTGQRPSGCTAGAPLAGYQFSCSGGTYQVSALCPGSVAVESGGLPQGVTFSSCPTIDFYVLGGGTNIPASPGYVTVSLSSAANISSFKVTTSGEVQR